MGEASQEHVGMPAWASFGDRSMSALTSLHGRADTDVCVIGLGASGLTAALRACERGADVVALDTTGIAAGAAGRNGGFLLAGVATFHHETVAAHGRDRAAHWYRLTLEELQRTIDVLPPGTVRRTGSLRIAASPDEETDCAQQLAALRTDQFPAEPYDGPEGRGLLVPTDAAFDPHARCRALAQSATAAGTRLHAPNPVDRIGPATPAGRVPVHAAGAEIHARHVVVAVDGGLETLLPELRGRVRTARLQMLATAPATDVAIPRPVYRRWGYDYMQQLPTGQIMLGGCRDRGGDNEWDAPADPTTPVQNCLDGELRRLGVAAPVTHRWAGRAAFTDDRLPVCEEVRPGVYAVGGYSGHGNLLGTWCARVAVDAALDGTELRFP
jgi:gamma-glutamylputrescine oxidase